MAAAAVLEQRDIAINWEELARALYSIQLKVKAGGDELEAASLSLGAVVHFLDLYPSALHHLPNAMDERVTRSLHLLEDALSDLQNGGKPPLLSARRGKAGRPVSTTFDWIRAHNFRIDPLLPEQLS